MFGKPFEDKKPSVSAKCYYYLDKRVLFYLGSLQNMQAFLLSNYGWESNHRLHISPEKECRNSAVALEPQANGHPGVLLPSSLSLLQAPEQRMPGMIREHIFSGSRMLFEK